MAGGFTEEQADTAVTVAADVAGATLVTQADLRDAMQQQTIRIAGIVGGIVALAVAILSMVITATAG